MPKILIVDDDRTTAKLLVTLFELEGFEVDSDARPDSVHDSVRALQPDACIIDCHLADRDGVALLRELRADPDLSRVAIVMTSGLDRGKECLREGANAFVLKPFSPAELIDTVRHSLKGVQN